MVRAAFWFCRGPLLSSLLLGVVARDNSLSLDDDSPRKRAMAQILKTTSQSSGNRLFSWSSVLFFLSASALCVLASWL
jgi:hypothetical protein